MATLQLLTASEQVAQHLRDEISKGTWTKVMPGCNHLVRELGVGRNTIDAALLMLEEEGLLMPQGVGRRRLITRPQSQKLKALTIQLLVYEESQRKESYLLDLIYELRELGVTAVLASKTLSDLKMDLKKVIRFVDRLEADMWLVGSASGEILQWFASRPVPVYALFGRLASVKIAGAGTLKSPAMEQAVRRLVELGHRRIVMMTRPERRRPGPGLFERKFLDSLAASSITVGNYHLPDWDNDATSFKKCLDSLFAHTPPTAMFFSEAQLYVSALHYFSARGLRVPQDVSMICHDADEVFDWQMPVVSHLHWDSRLLTRHVLRWVKQVARGKASRRQILIKAEFEEGETIGPASKSH
jgi:DNA-binding LacI/PurR family transcriptional regulator